MKFLVIFVCSQQMASCHMQYGHEFTYPWRNRGRLGRKCRLSLCQLQGICLLLDPQPCTWPTINRGGNTWPRKGGVGTPEASPVCSGGMHESKQVAIIVAFSPPFPVYCYYFNKILKSLACKICFTMATPYLHFVHMHLYPSSCVPPTHWMPSSCWIALGLSFEKTGYIVA